MSLPNCVRDLPYSTSAKGLGGFRKWQVFDDVQYCFYADIVGGSKKIHKCADVMQEWSIMFEEDMRQTRQKCKKGLMDF